MDNKTTILFHRDFQGFTGGHLKVWDYYQHIQSSDRFTAEIFFTINSTWKNNPWSEVKDQCLGKWNPENADILFLAGMDWLALSEYQRQSPPAPVVNFIQHVRHAYDTHPLFQFLKYPATRVCVSQQVADAIEATNKVNGPIIVNSNGIDHSLLPKPLAKDLKDIPLLIVGLKNHELTLELSKTLLIKGMHNIYVVDQLSRNEFLSLMNRSHVIVFLPTLTEGFYLPALEAMFLGVFVICPDCVGNRSFCLDNITCLRPKYTLQNILESIEKVLKMGDDEKDKIIRSAKKTSREHSIIRERKAFLELLPRI